MSDLRGLSRGSKAAAVVILVVLLQVIVVAVLGLGTIARDREERARTEQEDAAQRARSTAYDAVRQALDGLDGALAKAAAVARGPGGLANIARDGWLRAFREVYRVDDAGRVRSAGGRTLLRVPADVIALEEAPQSETHALDDYQRQLAAHAAAGTLSSPDALAVRARIVREYRWHVDDRYATAVGEALALAREAAKSRTATPPQVEEAVLLAWETAALNEGRPSVKAPGLAFVDGELDAIARALPAPQREALEGELLGLRRDRERLAQVRDSAWREAQDAAAREAPPRAFARAGEHVAVVSLPRTVPPTDREALLVRLDRDAAGVLLDDAVTAAHRRDAGVSFRAVPREAPREDATGAARVPVADGRLDLDLDAVARPIEGFASSRAGPREAFYWSILGLAVLGVSAAGLVLWRVLRREVHLARLKADFVSNLSHELKTPLTSISMFTEMIREGRVERGPEMREAVDVIAAESDRLQRLVSRMIDVARREAGATAYALAPGDLDVPVRAACERFRRLTREPGLDLAVDLAPSLPPVALDADAIDDALTNLLSNAWKYRRGDAAKVRVATRARGRRVEVVVVDDGIGIPRRERRRVFETFYRAENYLSRTVPGTGLGLALVRTIVRVHRGTVRVEATPGGGSTFRMSFPRARTVRTASPRGGGAPASPSAGEAAAGAVAPAHHGVGAR